MPTARRPHEGRTLGHDARTALLLVTIRRKAAGEAKVTDFELAVGVDEKVAWASIPSAGAYRQC